MPTSPTSQGIAVAKSHSDLSNEAGTMSERKYWGRREVREPRGNSYTEMLPDSDS